MDKKRLFLKMDYPQLEGSFEANSKQNKLLSSGFSSKVDNYLGSFGRGGKIATSGRLNNLQHVFNEDYAPKKSLKEPKKLYTMDTVDDGIIATRYKKMAKINNDSDGNDTDRAHKNSPRSQSGSNIKSKYTFNDESPIPKKPSHSYKVDDFKNDNTFLNSTNIYNSSPLLNDLNAETFNTTPPETKISTNDSLPAEATTKKGEINFIMLIGLFVGLVISKALIFVLLYLSWLLEKILQVRNAMLGTSSMWELLNLNDSRNFHMQYKLVLLPFAFISSLIYGFLYILYGVVRFLLTSAPNNLIKFIQNMHG